jgi:PAS domain S-box-containing protein
MSDENKTKKQLIEELNSLRTKIAEIEKAQQKTEMINIELKSREKRFEDFLESLNEAIYEADLNGNIIYGNKAAFNLFGYSQDDLKNGLNIFQMILPEERELAIDNFKKLIKGQSSHISEYTGLTKQGNTFPMTVYGNLVYENGKTIGTRGIVIDVSKIKFIEKSLQESEARYKKLVSAITDYIYTVTVENGKAVSTVHGPGCESVTGYSSEEFQNDPYLWYKIIFEKDREAVINQANKILSDKAVDPLEHRITHKDGTLRWVRNTPVPHFDETGKLVAYDGLISDITERKLAEEKLLQKSSELETIFKALPDLYFRMKSDGTILDYKAGQITDLYVPPEVFLGKRMQDVVPPNVMVEEIIKRVLETRSMVAHEYSLLMPEGIQYFEARVMPLFDDEIIMVIRNVTQRIHMEKILKRSEEKYRMLFQDSPLGVINFDENGIILECNDKYAEIIGSTREKLIGFDMLKSINDKMMLSAVQKALSGEIGYYEGDYLSVTGNKLTSLKAICSQIKDDSGKFLLGIEIIEDISERRKSEIELKESEERYRKLVELSPIAICVYSKGKIVFINSATMKLMGANDPSQMIGKNVMDFVHPDYKESVLQRAKYMINEGKTVPAMEEKFIRLDGSIIDVEVTAMPMIYQHEQSIQVVIKDITERKKAEVALAEEKERLAVTLRSIGDGVITTDINGIIVLMNKVAEQLTGWTQVEAKGQPLDKVFHIINERTRQKCLSPVRKVLETKGIVVLANHTVLISKDGTEKVLADSGAPIRDNESNIIGVVLVFRDITEKQRLDNELQKAQKLESVGVLAGGIAHDFNNILTGIIGNLSLVKLYINPKDKAYSRLIEMEKAAERAKDLTQQLLTFSKGGIPIKKVVSIGDILKDSASFAVHGSNVKLEFSIAEDLWNAEVDEGQFNQVINNVVLNATQAMPQGGIININAYNVDRVDERFRPGRIGKYIKIEIRDHGIGIPKDHLQKVFDPFFTTKQKGSGLGLAISYSIIKKHDGYMFVESELGAGSIFYIYLPSSKEIITEVDMRTGRIIKGHGRVLVMDDEDVIREIAGEILNVLGYDVEFSKDGNEAFEKYKKARDMKTPFDIVILDLTIPGGLGGKDTIMRLKEFDPDVKAIVSSGYSNDPIMSNYRDYGFCGVIVKPYDINEVSKALHDVIKPIVY